MKILTLFLLCCLSNTLAAAPKISEKLAKHTSAEEIAFLISTAEELFQKPVESVDYVYRDEPPVGDAAAIVHFVPEQKSETVYVFPIASFHYLPWSKDDPLPSKKKKITRGKWASDGELAQREKYRCALTTGIHYISFSKDVSYEEALELLTAIEASDYAIDLHTNKPQLNEQLSELDPEELRKLPVESINYLSKSDIWEVMPNINEYHITADVSDPERGLSTWMFAKRNNRYVLVVMLPYFI